MLMMEGGKRGRIRRLAIESPQAVRKWYRGLTAVTQTACEEGKLGLQITVRYWRVYYRSQRGSKGSITDHREALDSLLQITERHCRVYYRSLMEKSWILKVLIL